MKLLSRTYPQFTAGVPRAINFNSTTGAFTYTFAIDPVRVLVILCLRDWPCSFVAHVVVGDMLLCAPFSCMRVSQTNTQPTVIYVNEAMWYPHGLTVTVAGHAQYTHAATNRVLVTPTAGAQQGESITVQITAN